VTDPHQPGTPAGIDPGDLPRPAVPAEVLGEEEADAPDGVLGLGAEQGRF
jgi:hypothetical protein